ncbi:MAG: Crp/Fnr family transcriptional regulator [Chloroflexi bacterium]|nr:Crp/Fnr family transcriptional regulator [Chloroflexota bacterium]
MTITAESLGKLKYFAGLEPQQLSNLPQLFKEKAFVKGQTIVAEADINENVHFVSSGVVKVFKTSSEGKEQIIKLIRPGESFNDIPVFNPGPSPYSAQALGNTLIYWIDKKDLLGLMRNNWAVTVNALSAVADQSRLLLQLVEDLSFKNVTGRVAKILLQHSTPGPEGTPRLTQYEMAAMAGTAREVVGRSLKALEDSGAIKLEGHRMIISNKEYLKQLAGLN